MARVPLRTAFLMRALAGHTPRILPRPAYLLNIECSRRNRDRKGDATMASWTPDVENDADLTCFCSVLERVNRL